MAGETEVKGEQPKFVETKGLIKLTKTELLKDKESGLTVPEQATKYSLPVSQMRKALKIAGITIKAKKKSSIAKFEIVEG